MQLERAHIRNFRSLRDVEVEFGSHTALIGGNGAGKSSILRAIEKFYATSKTCEPDDYFGRQQENPIEIELTFKDLTEQEQASFGDRVRDGRLAVKRIFDGGPGSGRYHGLVPQCADFVAVRGQPNATAKREAYRALRENNPAYSDLPAASSANAVDQALTEWETNNPDQLQLLLDDGQFFGFQNNSRGKLQRHTSFVFIPAVRDASADAADGKGSVIGRLLELLVRSQILQRPDVQQFKLEMTQRYQQLVAPENMPELGALAGTLTTDLRGLYRDAEVELAWRDVGDIPVPLPLAEVALKDDGFGGPVDRQGHGLQRAFIFTILQHLARTAAADTPSEADEVVPAEPQAPALILAIEEPELYQHPTKQRHFAEVLRKLSNGTLPGVQGHTQVIFGSHSPMFVSMGKPDELRLIRRTVCEESDFKECSLQALDLNTVARKLEAGWSKEPGTYSAQTLAPRLHILGTELAEGFFANGVVLVEGRSDKAALTAVARLMGLNFEAAGIAILSAEGKGNLDRPLVVFRELGIPAFVLWDCDMNKNLGDRKPDINLALARLANPGEETNAAPETDHVGESYAHFSENLERKIKEELTPEVHGSCLAAACEPFGISPSNETQKIPEVMFETLRLAREAGRECETLKQIVQAIWLYLQHEDVSAEAAAAATA
ncbi:ATP-dependent nuclease [Pseudorhizobium flavum]|uniref:Putative ATPase n=1 Tax=Pseudorhizobium flavum TaxID=1335061 RepID=A0A7X0DCG9_9HYPH|nr:ATP-dependent endonuclease [Pseudorhizobium flavum]MBB6179837.1 putative ATPase [Pseudorhizobium flavum]CAD6597099.1 ATP-dependent endonuclease [Pseudorhizobium flavum]